MSLRSLWKVHSNKKLKLTRSGSNLENGLQILDYVSERRKYEKEHLTCLSISKS